MTPTCGVCGVDLPSQRGRARKWCKEHRNTRAALPQKRLTDKLLFQRSKTPCPRCGQLHTSTAQLCRPCRDALCVEKRAKIVALWAEGLTVQEIARVVGTTPGSLSVQIHTMRSEGYDLPYRYKIENGVRIG